MREKIKDLAELALVGESLRKSGKTVALCHGCFDILHPGHLRYLAFARGQADKLVVTVTGDSLVGKGPERPFVPLELRMEALAALEMVDFVAASPAPTAVEAIEKLRPDLYVKGKEYETSADPRFIDERNCVERFGGRVIFSSGDVVYSSTHLIRAFRERLRVDDSRWLSLCRRHGISRGNIEAIFTRMEKLRFVVVGDVILDEYVHCDVLGVASESPVLNLSALSSEHFVGGAGIIASHLARLGCRVELVSVMGGDEGARWIKDRLKDEGITLTAVEDATRPTVRKSRYVVEEQKVMKVDDYRRHPLDSAIRDKVIAAGMNALDGADGALFADFGYGVLPDPVIDALATAAIAKGVQTSAVTSTSLRGNILRFPKMTLITPTEREARTSVGDFESGLSVLALNLYRKTGDINVAITLGARGLVYFSPPPKGADSPDVRLATEYIPALPAVSRDPMGAGDALAATAAAALKAGAPPVIACLIGDAAAAQEIQRFGNVPLDCEELREFLINLIPA